MTIRHISLSPPVYFRKRGLLAREAKL